MIASLQMYTCSSTAAAYDRFWAVWAAEIRNKGIDAPDKLTQVDDSETIWTDPKLLVSQTCGYPYAKFLRGKVRLIATPHYSADGCDGPNYFSWIVTRASHAATKLDDLHGTRAAFNGSTSQSGYNCFRALIAPHAKGQDFFSLTRRSGGHRNSLQMVLDGEVDCTAVDAVSFSLAVRENPVFGEELKRIAVTPLGPGLPFITSASRNDEEVEAIRSALYIALANPALAEDLRTLMITGATVLDDTDYDVCLEAESAATTAGYSLLS